MAKSSAITEWLDNPKRLITVAIIIVVVIVLLVIGGKYIKKLWQKVQQKIDANREFEDYVDSTGEQPTLSDDELKQMIKRLDNAFNYRTGGFLWGTDEDDIFAVFNQMRNGADVRRLVYLYGTNKDGNTLSEELHDELSSSDINQVNTILANRGINYTF